MELDQAARTRLKDTEAGLFTSDLTVNEYLLLEDAGYEPLGLVLGSSIYHVGYQRRRLRSSHELTVLSDALYHARELAMERMRDEAEELGADGVVGVRLTFQGFEGASHIAEFLAVGTAVRRREADPGPAPSRSPATCPARSSGRSCAPAPARSAWCSAPASTASPPPPTASAGCGCCATSRCPSSPRRSTTPASWP